MRKPVYNLVFPSGCQAMTIFDYKFVKVENYPVQLQKLQQLVAYYADVQIKLNTGEHAITAYVKLPRTEQKAVLEWGNTNTTALEDILLLLSIFTQRDVFVLDQKEKDSIIIADPRQYPWGGILSSSIPYKEDKSGESSKSSSIVYPCDIGFEENITEIYTLIRSKTWQDKYKDGYFLFLAKQAFRRQSLESAFSQCWTIWEHLFATQNKNWLSDEQIEKLKSSEKIAFILTKYALQGEITPASRKRIDSLAKIRNRIVHYGRFPMSGSVHDDAILFIRLTEFVLAKILGLSPSNLFNTVDKLEKFLGELQKP